MTSSGIEPATFRFVAQHLNHCAIAVPHIYIYIYIYMCVCVCVCVCVYQITRNAVIDTVYSSLRNVKAVETRRILSALHVTTIGEKTNISRVLVQPSSALLVPCTELIK